MDAFVKWRAGEIKGYTQRLLDRLKFKLFCMEEFESFDVHQVVAALTNLPVSTLLMVGDIHQRVEVSRRGSRRATFDMREPSVALSLATHQLDDDGEEYDDRQTMSLAHSSVAVPESRPWHEWCAKAEQGGAHSL